MSQKNKEIQDLVKLIKVPIEGAPSRILIQGEPETWYKGVEHEFDKSRRRDAIQQLLEIMNKKISAYKGRLSNSNEKNLLDRLYQNVNRSNDALLEAAVLVGLKRKDGLFTKIKEINSKFGSSD